MASVMFLTLLFLTLLLGCSCLSFGEGEGQHYHVFDMESLMPKSTCSAPKGSLSNASLLVVHQHGPCSPLAASKPPTFHELLRRDQQRVEYLTRRILNGSGDAQVQASKVTIPTRRGDALGYADYIVTVGYGTPAKDQIVAFDTGSDLNWIQCDCQKCYPQQGPTFNSSESTSYRNVSCASSECTRLPLHRCSGTACNYGYGYKDNSFTIGYLARETLTLTPGTTFMDFVFGCGFDNEGLFKGVAGLIGLGRDPLSLVSQISPKFGKVFSYCFPQRTSSIGYLKFGDSGSTASGPISYTPMLTDKSAPSLYSINLTGISVGGKQLSISPSIFSSVPTFIDSGTVITRLPPSAYEALRSAFKSYMSAYPTAPAFNNLDTCFDFSKSSNISVPRVALQFGGAAMMNLDISGILLPVSPSQVCLAFIPDKTVALIGNVQQKTFEVIYDIGMQRIGFGPGAC